MPFNPLYKKDAGFTLIEVVITISILAGMVLIISQMLRGSFDMRQSLSQKNQVTGRINRAMLQMNHDLTHVFIIDDRMPLRSDQIHKRTLFRVEKSLGMSTLSFTYMGHRAHNQNAAESNLSYVVYQIQPSKKIPGRSHLFRGEYPRVPESFKEKPPMEPFVEYIKSMSIEMWDGEKWQKDGWDSTRSDTNNRLPHMVRITLQAWNQEPVEGVTPDESQESLTQYSTIVYVVGAISFNELKQRTSSFELKALQ